MLSESQERMLVVVKAGHLGPVEDVFQKWGLATTVIGTATVHGADHTVGSVTVIP